MKIIDEREDGQIPVDRIWHGRCFEFDGHFYMRVRLDSTYAAIHVPSNHIAAINLRAGSIRALHNNTLVRPITAAVYVIRTGIPGEDFGDKSVAEPNAGAGRDEGCEQ